MEDKSKIENSSCFGNCDDRLEACLNRGEDESVCRMEQVPCICSCQRK